MSKLVFVFIVCSCLVAVVTAATSGTTVIQVGFYSDNACTIPSQAGSISNYTAGQCIHDEASFYTSPDNAFVYQYAFSGNTQGCLASNISFVLKVQPGVCGSTLRTDSTFTLYTIFPATVTPAPLTSFPPPNFFAFTQYLNPNNSAPADTCDTTRTVVSAYPAPAPTNPCQVRNGFSYQSFLDPTCTNQVTAYYSDTTCTNVVQVGSKTVPFKSCVSGIVVNCGGAGIPAFPSTLSVGYTQYDNNQCITNSKARTTVSTNGGCLFGSTLACGMVNGTQMLISTNFPNDNCTGSVTHTTYVATDMCVVNNGDVQNVTATCHATPPSPTPSSTGGGPTSGSSSTGSSGSGNGTSSSTGSSASSADWTRSVSIGSILIGMIIGFMTLSVLN